MRKEYGLMEWPNRKFNVDGGIHMETEEMIYAEKAVKKGYDIEMECNNGEVRIRAGRMMARRKETISFLPIEIC